MRGNKLNKFMLKKYKRIAIMLIIAILVSILPLSNAEAKGKSKISINKIYVTKSYTSIYWQNSGKANKFYVYKKIGNGKYKKIATLSGNRKTYKDRTVKLGEKYTYKIYMKKFVRIYKTAPKQVEIRKLKTPKISTIRNSKNNREYVNIKFNGKKGYNYQIYRKNTKNGVWKKLSVIKGKTGDNSYIDKKVKKGKNYYYAVRAYKKSDTIYFFSDLSKSMDTILGVPKIKAKYGNLNTKLTWNALPGLKNGGYRVYRKNGITGKYRHIGTTSKNYFDDIYSKTIKTKDEKKLLKDDCFVDPVSNSFIYTVKAYSNISGQYKYGPYLKEGTIHMEKPIIISVDSGNITWGTVKNAVEYYIYSGYRDKNGKTHWKKLKTVKHTNNIKQTTNIQKNSQNTFYTVKARYNINGKNYYSKFEKNFSKLNYRYSKSKVLFLGDSITYGSPYKSAYNKEIFSYPYRVGQLTGAEITNLSIPGASLGYKPGKHWLIGEVIDKVNLGIKTSSTLHKTNSKLKDYDVVVIAAGTNDYGFSNSLGSIKSLNNKEFNGALNYTLNRIKEANHERINSGKKEIKVVIMNLFYSNLGKDHNKISNRFITHNEKGLTLRDYQNNIDKIIEKFKESGMKIYKFNSNNIVNSSNCYYKTADNLHMSRATYAEIGNSLTSFMINYNILNR